jgi:hypothetical protein
VCVEERDDVMVVCESAHDKKLNTQHAAGLYHLRDNKFLEPALDLGECSLSEFRFKESLVRHAFFDLPRSPDFKFIPFDPPPPPLPISPFLTYNYKFYLDPLAKFYTLSHRIFGHMHGVLNIDEKIINYTDCV